MINLIKGLFGIAKDSKGILQDIGSKRQKSKGTANRILAETEFNMELILVHYLRNNVPADKIIPKFRIKNLEDALDEGFDFTSLKKGQITTALTKSNPFLERYNGNDCEELFKNIRKHILLLQLLPELYDLSKETSINVKTRMNNLGKRYLLLARFLKS